MKGKWTEIYRKWRVRRCLRQNEDRNAYLLIRGRRVYRDFEFARNNVPCLRCGNPPVNGHDFCIAKLPGIKAACCGHGNPDKMYIAFNNGIILHEDNGRMVMDEG